MSEPLGPYPDNPDAAAPADNLTAPTVSGLRWSYVASIGTAVIQLVYVAIMSRLLEPAVFGLMAIAHLAVQFGFQFARMGVAQALIQKRDLVRDDVRAAFTASVALGSAFFGVLWALAPFIAGLFSEPDVVPVLRASGLTFLIIAVATISQALLRRSLRFRELAIIQLASYLLGYLGAGVGLALAGAGVWSLVGAFVGTWALQWLMQYARTRHSMRPLLSVKRFRSIYSFGARVSLIRVMEFLGKSIDTVAVGRYTTTALLGQYNRAFYLVQTPLYNGIAQSLQTVLFPGFSRIQNDDARLKRAYLSVLGLGGLTMFPVCAGIAVAAQEIVAVVLGDGWDVVATIVPFLTLAYGCNLMSKFAELLCEARAELNKVLTLQTSYLALLVALLVLAAGGPVWGFALAVAVGEVIRHGTYLVLMRRVLAVRFAEVARCYAPAALAATAVAATISAGRHLLLAQEAPVVLVLVVEVALGALSLGLCIRFNPMPEVRHELRRRLASAGVLDGGGGFSSRVATALVGRS